MAIQELNSRLKKINLNVLATLVLDDLKEEIVELNQAQMYDGKTNKGDNISPSYSRDSYFTSTQKAENYANWKQKITPNPNRNADTPNLFVDGTFYDSLFSKKQGTNFVVDTNTSQGKDIKGKFDNIMGLNDEYMVRLQNEKFIQPFTDLLKVRIGI